MDDARQIGGARDFDRPLHERLRDRHERLVEHRLEQPVPLLLLPGGEDHRRAGELRVVQRTHRVAEARHDVHVRRGEAAACAAVAVGHRHHRRLLQPEDELELRKLRHHFHDRELGGTGIAEEVGDAFVEQELDERVPAGGALHRR